MVKDIKKIFHHIVLLASTRNQELGIRRRHDGDCRAQAHELHRHMRLAILRSFQGINLAGRKRQRSTRGEAQRLTLRRDEIANRLQAAFHLLQHAHSLKKVDAKRLFVHHPAKIAIRRQFFGLAFLSGYNRACVPALGGHFPSASFLRVLRAVSCEKLFIEA